MGEDGVVGQRHALGGRRPVLVSHGLLDLRLLLEHAILVRLWGDPVAGVDDVRAAVACQRIVGGAERRAAGGAVLPRPLVYFGVQVVAFGPGHGDVHAEAGGDEQCRLHRAPGAGQRAGAPTEQEVLALQRGVVRLSRAAAVPFGPAHHVGQTLAGVEAVIGHVDDGHVSPLRVFAQHLVARAVVGHLVFQDADADAGHVASHDPSGIFDGLPGLLLRLEAPRRGGHELSMAAQLGGGGLERKSRAHRGIVEEHQKGLVLENARPTVGEAVALHLRCQIEDSHQLLERPLLRADEIFAVEIHDYLHN